ncbi:MAG TPA: hypothetical protein VH590_20105 [Ktedonobacterales bacterium]
MRTPKASVGTFILHKRVGRYTFRIWRARHVKPIATGEGWSVHSVLRSPTPFQRRLRRIFPWLQPRPRPTDARHVITLELPFPGGEFAIEIFRHPAR